jgi:hypothetical protein
LLRRQPLYPLSYENKKTYLAYSIYTFFTRKKAPANTAKKIHARAHMHEDVNPEVYFLLLAKKRK